MTFKDLTFCSPTEKVQKGSMALLKQVESIHNALILGTDYIQYKNQSVISYTSSRLHKDAILKKQMD